MDNNNNNNNKLVTKIIIIIVGLIFTMVPLSQIIIMVTELKDGGAEGLYFIIPFMAIFVIVGIIIIITGFKGGPIIKRKDQDDSYSSSYKMENKDGRDYSYHWDDKPVKCLYCNYEIKDNKFKYCPICGNKIINRENYHE